MNTTFLILLIVVGLVIEKIFESWLFKKYPKLEKTIDRIGLFLFIGSTIGFIYSVIEGVDPSHFIVASVVLGRLAMSSWLGGKQTKNINVIAPATGKATDETFQTPSTSSQQMMNNRKLDVPWYKNRYVIIGAIFAVFVIIGSIGENAQHPTRNSTASVPSVPEAFNRVLKYEASEWTNYTSPSAHFTAKFPQLPQRKENVVFNPDVQQNMTLESYFASDKSGNYYSLNYTEYPEDYVLDQDTKANLELFLNNSIATGENNALLSSSFTAFQGVDAIDFEMYQASTKSYYRGLLTIRGQRSYQMLVVNTNRSDLNDSNYEKFFNSFEFLK